MSEFTSEDAKRRYIAFVAQRHFGVVTSEQRDHDEIARLRIDNYTDENWRYDICDPRYIPLDIPDDVSLSDHDKAVIAYAKQAETDFPKTKIHYPKPNTQPPKPRHNAGTYKTPRNINGTDKR